MITVKFPRHHSMSVRTSAAQIRAVTDTLILQEAVCAGFQLISTHSPCSRIGSKFRTYFMLIWILKILPTGHGFARIQRRHKQCRLFFVGFSFVLIWFGFCWIPLCFVYPVEYHISTPCTLIKLSLQKLYLCPPAQEFELVVYPCYLVSHL